MVLSLHLVLQGKDERESLERRRQAYDRLMQATPCCPVPGPCFECHDLTPHHCPLGAVLRYETDLHEAIALALDSVIYGDGPDHVLPEPEATRVLLGRLCREHRALALIGLGRAASVTRRETVRRRTGS